MSKRTYISGPMTGIPDLNRSAFHAAAEKLRQQGFTVFNPAAANLEGWSLRKILAYELEWICREAEAIALLPGWENSKGVAAELATAKAIGLEIIHL